MRKSKQVEHICEYCGAHFKARVGAKYCCASCRVMANNAKRELKAVSGTSEIPKNIENLAQERAKEVISSISPTITNQISMEQIKPVSGLPPFKDVLLTAAVYYGLNYLFSPKKKRKLKY